MVHAALIIAAIVDVALAALMVAISGFRFGSGPESMHGGVLLAAAYAAGGSPAWRRQLPDLCSIIAEKPAPACWSHDYPRRAGGGFVSIQKAAKAAGFEDQRE